MRELCGWKGVTIIEAEVCPDHIHVDTVGKNTKKIAEYIQNQLEEDKLQDQLTFREYEDPSKGSK